MKRDNLSYKDSGVDITAGEKAVNLIKPLVRKTFNKNVLTEIGGFGGLYELDLENWTRPVLVASTDGVGTKIIVARMAGVYDTIGQDLVNHCVNDILVQGAFPRFFMDYIGVGRLNPQNIEKIVEGLALSCSQNKLALIGGEMAEMPGIYSEDDFDLVGTIVGLVEKNEIIDGSKASEGDVVIGFRSSGLHTNGYSLARTVLFDKLSLKIDSIITDLGKTVAEALLEIHLSYLPIIKPFLQRGIIKAMAHITGGGIEGNLKRVIPTHLTAVLSQKNWQIPDLFRFIEDSGKIVPDDMYKTFNMGIGFIVIVSNSNKTLFLENPDAFEIGWLEKSKDQNRVILTDL